MCSIKCNMVAFFALFLLSCEIIDDENRFLYHLDLTLVNSDTSEVNGYLQWSSADEETTSDFLYLELPPNSTDCVQYEFSKLNGDAGYLNIYLGDSLTNKASVYYTGNLDRYNNYVIEYTGDTINVRFVDIGCNDR